MNYDIMDYQCFLYKLQQSLHVIIIWTMMRTCSERKSSVRHNEIIGLISCFELQIENNLYLLSRRYNSKYSKTKSTAYFGERKYPLYSVYQGLR